MLEIWYFFSRKGKLTNPLPVLYMGEGKEIKRKSNRYYNYILKRIDHISSLIRQVWFFKSKVLYKIKCSDAGE